MHAIGHKRTIKTCKKDAQPTREGTVAYPSAWASPRSNCPTHGPTHAPVGGRVGHLTCKLTNPRPNPRPRGWPRGLHRIFCANSVLRAFTRKIISSSFLTQKSRILYQIEANTTYYNSYVENISRK